jgi:pyridoxal phosphate enzyme (YggS family)
MSTIAENAQRVRERIAEAAARAGRKATDITLVAVTKTHPAQTVLEGYAAGLRHFGENRVQEAAEKIPPVLSQAPQAHWHLIGHLQRNKVRQAVEMFSLIHSVDSVRLAEAISQRSAALGKRMPILLEVNLSGEESKSGFRLGADLAPFFREVEQIARLPGVQLQGLMTIAAYSPRAEDARPVFERLRGLRGELATRIEGEWPHLSMGMSADYVVAIEEGATLVRVGTAIFGERV